MANIVKQAMAVATVLHGKATPIRTFPEAASQTYKKGALLLINADGKVEEVAADPTRIDGVALADASGTTDADADMALVTPGTIFQANVSGSGTTVQADVGDQRGVVKDGDNWHIDEAETADAVVEITGLRSDVNDVNGIVYFKFLPTVITPLLDASGVANIADANVEGGVPVIFRLDIAAGALADNDLIMKHKIRVIDCHFILTGAGVSTTTFTLRSTAADISDVMAASGSDGDLVRMATVDDDNHEIVAGGILRVTSLTGATQPAATVYVTAIRVS